MSREKDGAFNENYCRWCYADGDFTMDFWKQYADIGGKDAFKKFKKKLIQEFNALLRMEGLPAVENLNVLPGSFITLHTSCPMGKP